MAGSNRDLWLLITGSGIFRPKALVQDEIKQNKEKLLQGLDFFKSPVNPAGETLKKDRKVDGPQLEFIQKLSRFLQLDELQSHDLFKSYLVHDYRGSLKELQNVLSEERHSQNLILRLRDYYHVERLYLLRCVKHILSHWQDARHPFREAYTNFVEMALENDQFIGQVQKKYKELCFMDAPSWEKHGNLMNEKQAAVWMMQNLKEQCELLEIMLLHYKDFQHPADKLPELLKRFKSQVFGFRQTNKHLLEEYMQPLLHRIGFLQVLLVLEAVDLEHLHKCLQNSGFGDHHIAQGNSAFKAMDAIITTLGDSPAHGPILLMWSLMRHLVLEEEGAAVTRKMGNMSLQLNVFLYLNQMLEREPFSGKTTVGKTSKIIVSGLLSVLLSVFHEDTLGDTESLYSLAAKLLSEPGVSEDMWESGLDEGLGMLLKSAASKFPGIFHPLMSLGAAMSSSSVFCAKKFQKLLEQLPTFTEHLDKNRAQDLEGTEDENKWRLLVNKKPYLTDQFVIPRGTVGEIFHQDSGTPVIQWNHTYNSWQLFLCEANLLLRQVAMGTGAVSAETVANVTDVATVVSAVLEAEPSQAEQFSPLLQTFCQLIHRFSLVSPPPLDLIASCLQALSGCAASMTAKVWHLVKQTGLLPFMTENLDNVQEISSGAGLHAGSYGTLLAGVECPRGRYPVTLALLQFLTNLVQPLTKAGRESEVIPCLLFVTREIFPAFQKWRYYDFCRREQMGQKCLLLFHRILNIIETKKPAGHRLSLRDTCVYSLLFTEAGRSLLDIISTGVDTVELALDQQGSVSEGIGIEMIQLLRLAFSVLNRLLLLRPHDKPPSPVEQSLSSWPANRSQRHAVATIAQYIYHQQDPRLPTLATLLLKRLAVVFPMSILACFGQDAEAIRDIYLARLQADTEDIRLKIVIMELMAECVETQPGLTEIFLDVQLQAKKDGKKDWSIGDSSCLPIVLSLIDDKKQGTYRCPAELVCACIEFIYSLWDGHRETAMEVLRTKPNFWQSLCLSLMRNLPKPGEGSQNREAQQYDIKTCANIWKIIALELYAVSSSSLNANFVKVLKEIVNEKRVSYWSKYLSGLLRQAVSEPAREELLSQNSMLRMLHAWRSIMLVVAVTKPDHLQLSDAIKAEILSDLLCSLQALFANDMTPLTIKLASVGSALYFTLLKHWKSCVKDWASELDNLQKLLTQTCANSETLIPSVQIGVLGSVIVGVQFVRASGFKDCGTSSVATLVPVVCSVLQQSTYQLHPAKRSREVTPTDDQQNMDIQVKLQVVSTCLLEELILALDQPDQWLPELKHHSLLPLLLASVQEFIQARQGADYVQAVFLLFHTLAKSPQGAQCLAFNGLTQHLCLCVSGLYTSSDSSAPPTSQSENTEDRPWKPARWQQQYSHMIQLYESMLATLHYSFLEDALNFVGTHQDRMLQCMECVHMAMQSSYLDEAERTCGFLCQLAHYRREWRLHLPVVLDKLMTAVVYLTQTCISYFIRPRLLQCILERHTGKGTGKLIPQDKLTPVTRRLSQQSASSDDSDFSSEELVQAQCRLLRVLSSCLGAMKRFSPDLCEILLDQSMDVCEYEPLLMIGFSTPTVDQETPPTFGTIISCVSMCTRLLTKSDHKSSPAKSPVSGETVIPKNLLMYVLENCLVLIMSQSVRHLRDPGLSVREKQLLKRELSAELNSFLMSVNRHFKRGVPSSPAASDPNLTQDKPTLVRSQTSMSFTGTGLDQSYFKLIDVFVKQVLR